MSCWLIHRASAQTIRTLSERRRCRSAVSKFRLTAIACPSQQISLVSFSSPQQYDSASYSGVLYPLSKKTARSRHWIGSRKAPGNRASTLVDILPSELYGRSSYIRLCFPDAMSTSWAKTRQLEFAGGGCNWYCMNALRRSIGIDNEAAVNVKTSLRISSAPNH
jgi:hypothetical protein